MRYLIPVLFIFTLAVWAEVTDRRPISSDKDLDGLYYVISKAEDFEFSALVLSERGTPIPQKANDPDAPTQPGFYHDNIRYPFVVVRFNKGKIEFETQSIKNVKFRYSGTVEMKPDPEFDPDVPLRVFHGKLDKILNGQKVQSQRITFGEAVIY